MKFRTYAIVLALAAAPLPALAQNPAPAPDRPRAERAPGEARRQGEVRRRGEMRRRMEVRRRAAMQRRGMAERLIARREQLKLTDQQVARLQAIDRDLEGRNRAALERIRTIRESAVPRLRQRADSARAGAARMRLTEEERAALRRSREQVRPQMEQLRQNREAARREIESVLTAQQKEQLRAAREANRGRGREMRERPREEVRQRTEVRPGS